MQPWLNPALYSDFENENTKLKNKIAKISNTDSRNVEVQNMYDVMMGRLGINTKEKQ